MTAEKIKEIIQNNSALKMLKPSDLEYLIEKYPYWQITHALQAKYNYLSEIKNPQVLNKAALYAADRSKLKAFINEINTPIEEISIAFYNESDTAMQNEPIVKNHDFVAQITLDEIEKIEKNTTDFILPEKQNENISEKIFLDKFEINAINIVDDEIQENALSSEFERIDIHEKFDKETEEEIKVLNTLQVFENMDKIATNTILDKSEESEKLMANDIATAVYESQFIKNSKAFLEDNINMKELTFIQWLQYLNKSKTINEIEQIQSNIERKQHNIYDDELDEEDLALQDFVKPLADKSTQIHDVISENYAKILAMQGRNDKAIEVYEKLSLMNPEKKHIFAIQIEKLK